MIPDLGLDLRLRLLSAAAARAATNDPRTPEQRRANLTAIANEFVNAPKSTGVRTMDIAFTLEYFEFVRREQTAGRFAVDRFVVGDGQPEKEPGLRAMISDSGVSFHVKYVVDGKPCFFQLGRFPETSIEDARAMAKAALDMASGGVDPVEEMQIRLRRELLARGAGGGRA